MYTSIMGGCDGSLGANHCSWMPMTCFQVYLLPHLDITSCFHAHPLSPSTSHMTECVIKTLISVFLAIETLSSLTIRLWLRGSLSAEECISIHLRRMIRDLNKLLLLLSVISRRHTNVTGPLCAFARSSIRQITNYEGPCQRAFLLEIVRISLQTRVSIHMCITLNSSSTQVRVERRKLKECVDPNVTDP